jgi:hypothetical protein
MCLLRVARIQRTGFYVAEQGLRSKKFRACSLSDFGSNGLAGDDDLDSTVLLAALCELLDRLKELFWPKMNK